jgi:rhodanese-related sulfurtransferase
VSTSVAIEEISVADLRARLKSSVDSGIDSAITLIDVREDDEWEAGHIHGARHVPLGSVPDRLDEFDGAPTYVICRVGGRSWRACEFADGLGRPVANVVGGMLAWADAGFEICRD